MSLIYIYMYIYDEELQEPCLSDIFRVLIEMAERNNL